MSAWLELNEERKPSDNPKTVHRLTRRQIKDWLIWHNLQNDAEFANDLVAHIFAIDAAYIPIQVKRQQRQASKAGKGGRNGKGHKS